MTTFTVRAGRGEIFLIVFLFLVTETQVDSKPHYNKQEISSDLETTMEDIVQSSTVLMNDDMCKRTTMKKRNFINMVKKFRNRTITTTSTCTPFFIPRTNIIHRKTARLKQPTDMTQSSSSAENEQLSQKKGKGHIKKLFFPEHSSTPLFVKNTLELFSENKKELKASNIPILPEPISMRVTEGTSAPGSFEGLNVTVNENINVVDSLATIHNVTPSETGPSKSDYVTTQSAVASTLSGLGLTSEGNQAAESTVSSLLWTNMTSAFNTSVSKKSFAFKKFNFKNMFPFTKVSPFKSNSSFATSQTGAVSHSHKHRTGTSPLTTKTTENYVTTRHAMPNTSLVKNSFEFKRIFHGHQNPKSSQLNHSTEQTEKLYTSEPILEQITNDYETQIPSSPKSRTIGRESEIDLSTVIISSPSTESYKRYMHFRNMLHREPRTTQDRDVDSAEWKKDSSIKTNKINSDFESETPFTNAVTLINQNSKSHTFIPENNNHATCPLKFKKPHFKERGSKHSTFETSTSENDVFNYSLQTTDSNNSGENLENRSQGKESMSSHNPFKIKYLVRFRSPVSSTQDMSNDSSSMETTCWKTYTDVGDMCTYSKSQNVFVNITTECMNRDHLNGDVRGSNQKHYDLPSTQTPECRIKDINSTEIMCEIEPNTQQFEETKAPFKFNNIIGFKKHKSHAKTKNHKQKTSKQLNPRIKDCHNQVCFHKPSTEEDFMDRLRVTVYKNDGNKFRDWFLGKATKDAKNRGVENEDEITFRWCVVSGVNESGTTTKTTQLDNYQINNTIPEMPSKNCQKFNNSWSNIPPENKFKNFFHFKTPQIPLSGNSTTVSTLTNMEDEDELKYYENTTIILQKTTKKHDDKNKIKLYSVHGDKPLFKNFLTTVAIEHSSLDNYTGIHNQTEIRTPKSEIDSTDVKPNTSTQPLKPGKVKLLFNKFHTTKVHSLNNSFNVKDNFTNTMQNSNGTVILNPEFVDYVETKKHKKHFNRTVLHNVSDVNDTSFNVMAYVMKPLDSLVGVFKALSPNSVTKIGDVNATDIKNGSIPDHLKPPNSTIVILAVNNTNSSGTSKDAHESKLGMALDLLGGMYHCVFNNFAQVRPEDVHFYLYTRSNPDEPEELFLPSEPSEENVTSLPDPVFGTDITPEFTVEKREIDSEDDYEEYDFEALNPAKSDIQSKWFNIRAETKILIHGYLQDHQTDIMVGMRDAYLSRGTYNLVMVDWSTLVGDSSCYPVVASRGLRQVGSLLARLLDHLIEGGLAPGRIHVVGFSLGAHVAGHAGTFLSHGLISRITGLDPALPYVPMEPDVSLDSDDAVFVDIIHSAAGLLGQSGPMGHVDFYPNGGSQQPGCETSSLSCSHRRAALYFIESINSDGGFQATRCESWHHFQTENCTEPTKVLMGEPCPTNTSGKFYLVTGYKSPFSLQPKERKVKKSLLLDLFYESEDL